MELTKVKVIDGVISFISQQTTREMDEGDSERCLRSQPDHATADPAGITAGREGREGADVLRRRPANIGSIVQYFSIDTEVPSRVARSIEMSSPFSRLFSGE